MKEREKEESYTGTFFLIYSDEITFILVFIRLFQGNMLIVFTMSTNVK